MIKTNTTDRSDRVRELQEQLERQVAELVTGEDWANMLQVASRFHRYSANNVMLIMCQMPTATRVAGFNAWKHLGRHVRKGEHGIRILAPCRYKIAETETGEDIWRLAGFTTVSVFDISQTEGAELLDIRPDLLDGEAPAGLWDSLAAQVDAAGFTLSRCSTTEIGGANGRTEYGSRAVKVRDDVSDAQAVKTLAHELAHILCGHETELFGGCRGRLEVEAESVAYIVCHSAGLVSDGYSLPYVAGWSGGDVATVRQTAEKVVRVAGAICEAVAGAERVEVAA